MANIDNKSENNNIIVDSTKETRNALDKNIASGINKVFELLKSSPLGIKIDTYIAERPYKIEKCMEEINVKYKKIPEKYLTEPSAFTTLKAIQELQFSLDEPHLREMFENIIVSNMDKRKKKSVLPGYIDLVKQLSSSDVELLKLINDYPFNRIPILRVNFFDDFNDIFDFHIVLINNENYETPATIILDNLARLKIIDMDFTTSVHDQSIYIKCFKKLNRKYYSKQPIPLTLNYDIGILNVTSFGEEFLRICLD